MDGHDQVVHRRPGCYLAVERAGEVRAGDVLTVQTRPGHGFTMTDLMAAMTGDRSPSPRLRHAVPDLGVRGREWLARVSRAS
jgi:MOSC domain-containing protein YiiM